MTHHIPKEQLLSFASDEPQVAFALESGGDIIAIANRASNTGVYIQTQWRSQKHDQVPPLDSIQQRFALYPDAWPQLLMPNAGAA